MTIIQQVLQVLSTPFIEFIFLLMAGSLIVIGLVALYEEK